MKGIILAGGTGSRLYPLTKVTNKHLLPIGKYPMIYYPIYKLKEAGITDILIVTGIEYMGSVVNLLGSGRDFGVKFTYKVQDEAGGIAQALGLAEEFVNTDRCVVILGDNIFEDPIGKFIQEYLRQPEGAKILIKEVRDPRRFGVPEEDCMKIVREILDTIGKGYHIPAPNNIVIEDCQARNIVVIHVPLGTKGNLTLSLLIAGLIGEEYGITPLFNYTPYMIGLYLHRKLDVKNVMFRIFNLIRNMNERELLDIIARELRKTFTYKCRLINVAKRMGVIRRSQQFGKSISLDRLCRMLRDTPVDSETIREIIVEKLDINAIRWLKENLEKEKLKVVYMKVEDLNPISRDLFYSKRDIVLREIPTEQLLQVLKDRLLSSKVTLLCLSCFHIIDDIKIKYLGERPRCPKCGGLILGKAYSKEMAERVVKALKELKQGKKIRDKTLLKELKYVRETSELIAIYGRKALMILAGKGIGPEKAKKILFKASSEEEMLQLLIEAEKEYMRTRRFWHE